MPSKNKLSIENREQKKSVVQRFMSDGATGNTNEKAPEKPQEQSTEIYSADEGNNPEAFPEQHKNPENAPEQSVKKEEKEEADNTDTDDSKALNTAKPGMNNESITLLYEQMRQMQQMLEEQQKLINTKLNPPVPTSQQPDPKKIAPDIPVPMTIRDTAPIYQTKPVQNLPPAMAEDNEMNTDAILARIKKEEIVKSEPRAVTQYEPPKFHFKNTMEDAVVLEVEATLRNTRNMCKCERCFSDICAIVLNQIKPHYVTSSTGELYDKAALLNIINLSKISVEVFKAIDLVKSKPSHN